MVYRSGIVSNSLSKASSHPNPDPAGARLLALPRVLLFWAVFTSLCDCQPPCSNA